MPDITCEPPDRETQMEITLNCHDGKTLKGNIPESRDFPRYVFLRAEKPYPRLNFVRREATAEGQYDEFVMVEVVVLPTVGGRDSAGQAG